MVKLLALLQENEDFPVHGKVELFPQKGGWFFVRVPKQYSDLTKDLSDRGLVAITAKVGGSVWKTSLLPMGDGTHFIALPAKVRKKEKVDLNQTIEMTFVLRER
jgi:hypothetical protein